MPAWFDLENGLPVDEKETENPDGFFFSLVLSVLNQVREKIFYFLFHSTGLQESIDDVHALIKNEEDSGTPSENIFVGGFSQGAMMGLNSGVSYPRVPIQDLSFVLPKCFLATTGCITISFMSINCKRN
jgi:predicted esterase